MKEEEDEGEVEEEDLEENGEDVECLRCIFGEVECG